jgi:hypothetical protein
MAFVFKKSRNPNGGRELMAFTLADSTAFTVGQAVNFASGVLASCSGDEKCAGIIAAILKADGSPVTDNGAGADFTGTYTTSTSNTVQALIDVSIDSVYTVAADGTIGTTNSSDKPGINIDAATGGLTLSETSALAAGSTATFFSYGEDTDGTAPSNSLLVSIQESQIKI